MFVSSEKVLKNTAKDACGHMKLGAIGNLVSDNLEKLSTKFNKGRTVNTINQRLSYIAWGGDPDAIDAIGPMACGNLAQARDPCPDGAP